MFRTAKKLSLSRSVVRRLSDASLEVVAAGAIKTIWTWCPSEDCPTNSCQCTIATRPE